MALTIYPTVNSRSNTYLYYVEDINECNSNPCARGQCTNDVNDYSCNCTGTGFTGRNCDEGV